MKKNGIRVLIFHDLAGEQDVLAFIDEMSLAQNMSCVT